MVDFDIIKEVYVKLPHKIDLLREKFNTPFTLTEKVLYAHLAEELRELPQRGVDYCKFLPDRVAMQDATAQMALLQFINSGCETTAVPTTVHCDHLILAESGAEEDLKKALGENKEVYDFLESASSQYGIGFWKPGSGIIHQILLENYIFPGGMIIGTDSHTVNGGGLGMISIGVGGADAVDVMVGQSWELKMPKIIGVELTGELTGWASAKDVILKLAGILTAKGGTNKIIEYFGEGTKNISCTGKATICNMGAEVGATTSIFPFDEKMADFLNITNRIKVAEIAGQISQYLRADDEVMADPEAYYDEVIRIDLSELRPHINGPFTPDAARCIQKFDNSVKELDYPEIASAVLVGSCTNSSYEDLTAVASILQNANAKGIKLQTEFIVTPGSESIRRLCEKAGILDIITEAGGVIMANACGPCIGQWNRNFSNEKNSIVTTFNRNFAKRNDGNPLTHAFITSPELATAIALSGKITFDPENDFLTDKFGKEVKLAIPQKEELPPSNFEEVKLDQSKNISEIKVHPNSLRLQLLKPFEPLQKIDFLHMKLLIKTRGKCTTDHISMAGIWLKYRGHLENISNNLLLGAENIFYSRKGMTKNQLTGMHETVATVAKFYKNRKISSVIIAEENYGEGSSREHAAMEPRFLNVKMVIAKSFARIHETNLKKQGILAVTFTQKEDYDKIQEMDSFNLLGIEQIAPGENLELEIVHENGKTDLITLSHTYNEEQIVWLKAGSALNVIKKEKESK